MASITIRRLEESLLARLRARAVRHGRSMEEEAREILKTVPAHEPGRGNLAESIRARFVKTGEVELAEFPRERMRLPPDFDE